MIEVYSKIWEKVNSLPSSRIAPSINVTEAYYLPVNAIVQKTGTRALLASGYPFMKRPIAADCPHFLHLLRLFLEGFEGLFPAVSMVGATFGFAAVCD